MRFSIAQMLLMTTCAAVLHAIASYSLDLFFGVIMLLHALQFVFALGVLLTTIVFVDQRGRYLDTGSSPYYRFFKRLWLWSLICIGMFWLSVAIIVSIRANL